jgi:pimeloyl-ACP methyl ester carboxylesterase
VRRIGALALSLAVGMVALPAVVRVAGPIGMLVSPGSHADIVNAGAIAPTARTLDATPVGITGTLLQRIPKGDGLRVDIVAATDGKRRVIAYMGGTGPTLLSQVRNALAYFAVHDPTYARNVVAIKLAVLAATSWNNLFPDVMLVGYSQGGMDAQNIAHASNFDPALNVTTVVTFASPVNQFDSPVGYYETVHLRAAEDRIAAIGESLNFSDSVFLAATGLQKPPVSGDFLTDIGTWGLADVHDVDHDPLAYLTVANDFTRSTDPEFSAVKNNIVTFDGRITTVFTA